MANTPPLLLNLMFLAFNVPRYKESYIWRQERPDHMIIFLFYTVELLCLKLQGTVKMSSELSKVRTTGKKLVLARDSFITL